MLPNILNKMVSLGIPDVQVCQLMGLPLPVRL